MMQWRLKKLMVLMWKQNKKKKNRERQGLPPFCRRANTFFFPLDQYAYRYSRTRHAIQASCLSFMDLFRYVSVYKCSTDAWATGWKKTVLSNLQTHRTWSAYWIPSSQLVETTTLPITPFQSTTYSRVFPFPGSSSLLRYSKITFIAFRISHQCIDFWGRESVLATALQTHFQSSLISSPSRFPTPNSPSRCKLKKGPPNSPQRTPSGSLGLTAIEMTTIP